MMSFPEKGLPLHYLRRSIRRRVCSNYVWLLGLSTVFNLFLLHKWYHPSNQDQTPTPLDDFQMLKPQFASWTPNANADPNSRVVVTAVYNDLFAIPAAMLGYSLQKAGTSARRIFFHIPGRLSDRALCIVRAGGWEPLAVGLIPPPHDGKGIGSRFVDQYTKLQLWNLDAILGVKRVVYLDADTLVRRNFDELFDLPAPFGAVPDVWGQSGFKLNFNAGVLVLHPNSTTFESMRARIADARFNLHEAEQSFLNIYFGADAIRLPYMYNANLAIRERSPALWETLRDELRIIHYTLPKPFPTLGNGIVMGARLEDAIDKARKARGGVHAEAMDWWRTAYHEFRSQHHSALEQCDLLAWRE